MEGSKTRVRVLHIYAGNLYGGIERLLLTLAAERNLCPEMEPVFALCFDGRLADELRATGATVHMLGNVRLSMPWTVLLARHRLKQLLRTASGFDVAVTHSCWPHAAFAPAVRQAKTPLYFWAHDAYLNLSRIDRAASRTPPDYVISNSRFTLGTVPAVFPGIPGEVIYCPIALPAPMNRAAVRDEVRQMLGCPPQSTVVFMGARLEKWKGHTLLLEALALLKSETWQAWIAGGPQRPHEEKYYADLKAMATRLGIDDRVKWLGQRKDVPRLLAAADIHCQPNTGPEPFGIVFIEAMQAGLPVVTTCIGAAPEIIDSTCGVLTEPDNPQSLANALERVMLIKTPGLYQGGPSTAKVLCDPTKQLRTLYARSLRTTLQK